MPETLTLNKMSLTTVINSLLGRGLIAEEPAAAPISREVRVPTTARIRDYAFALSARTAIPKSDRPIAP